MRNIKLMFGTALAPIWCSKHVKFINCRNGNECYVFDDWWLMADDWFLEQINACKTFKGPNIRRANFSKFDNKINCVRTTWLWTLGHSKPNYYMFYQNNCFQVIKWEKIFRQIHQHAMRSKLEIKALKIHSKAK